MGDDVLLSQRWSDKWQEYDTDIINSDDSDDKMERFVGANKLLFDGEQTSYFLKLNNNHKQTLLLNIVKIKVRVKSPSEHFYQDITKFLIGLVKFPPK